MSFGTYGDREHLNENRSHIKPPSAWTNASVPPWSMSTRPLSDIRELTEPSLLEPTHKKPPSDHGITNFLSRKVSLRRKDSGQSTRSRRNLPPEPRFTEEDRARSSPLQSPGSQADHSSLYIVYNRARSLTYECCFLIASSASCSIRLTSVSQEGMSLMRPMHIPADQTCKTVSNARTTSNLFGLPHNQDLH